MKPHGFLERTLRRLLAAAQRDLQDEQIARRRGFLQGLDPRAKILGGLILALAATWVRSLAVVWSLLAVVVVLALMSRVPLRDLALRAWTGVFLFTAVLAAPALFLTPGDPVWEIPRIGWAVTRQGLRGVVLLVGRVETVATLTIILVATTPWTHVLKALRRLGVPTLLVTILNMTVRYIFLLLDTARDMFEARLSRMVGAPGAAGRSMVISGMGVLVSKSMAVGQDVYLAMQARGFQGDVYVLDEFRWGLADSLALGTAVVIGFAAAWLGR